MSEYKQHFSLRCSKCYEKYWRANYFRQTTPGWNNVVVIEQRGDHFLCECLTCQHKYLTGSQAANRQWKSQYSLKIERN